MVTDGESSAPDITAQVTVDLSATIGVGGHSDVYRGIMDCNGGQQLVAVKKHRYTSDVAGVGSGNNSVRLRLRCEIALWNSFEHPNILPLYGLYFPDELGSALPDFVTPWCDGGTVLDYLRAVRKGKVQLQSGPCENLDLLLTEVELLLQTTRGLKYLHRRNIIHGDVKSINVLVHKGVALLGDFGYSVQRPHSESQSDSSRLTSVYLGTHKFFAPEHIRPHAHRTKKADIWALGCVIMEVHTLQEPYNGLSSLKMFIALYECDLPYANSSRTNQYLWKLALACWSRDPHRRTTAQTTEACLENMRTTLSALIKHLSSVNFESTKNTYHSSLRRTVIAALEASGIQNEAHSAASAVVRLVARAIAARDSELAEDLVMRFYSRVVHPPLYGHRHSICSVAFLSGGRRLVSSSQDRTLRIWDIETRKTVIGPLHGHQRIVRCVAAHGSRIASCAYDGTFRVWDAAIGTLVLGPIVAHSGRALNCITYSSDGRYIATAGDDHRAVLWDAVTGVELRGMIGHTGYVLCVAFSVEGTRLVSSSQDTTIRIWDIASGQCIGRPLTGHTDWVTAVCFSPDNQRIFSSSEDKTVRVWVVETRTLAVAPLQMDDSVLCMALSPNGERLVSGSRSGTIALWNAQTGSAVMLPVKGHKDRVWGMAFSPDGRKIASASADQTIALWDATDSWKVNDVDEP